MILGVDPGARRTGVAVADEETRLARPLEVIDGRDRDPVDRVAELARTMEARLIVVGLPVSLSGSEGAAVEATRSFATSLSARTQVPVVEHDERLTTVVAEQGMRAAGATSRRRGSLRDAVAAQVMLQGYLDTEEKP